jgi:hypothetical protein
VKANAPLFGAGLFGEILGMIGHSLKMRGAECAGLKHK